MIFNLILSRRILSFVVVVLFTTVGMAANDPRSAGGVGPSPSTPAVQRQEIIFRYYPQKDQVDPVVGYVSASDGSPLGAAREDNSNLVIKARKKFALTVHWFVMGHGFYWLTADRGGKYYESQQQRRENFILNYELADSRMRKVTAVIEDYQLKGLHIPKQVAAAQAEAKQYLRLAAQVEGEVRARLADLALESAFSAGESLELAWANHQMRQPGFEPPLLGVDSRHYFWSNMANLNKYVPQLFDYATITHYLQDDWFPPFEAKRGDYRWGAREDTYHWLKGHGLEVQARPVLWFHKSVTPQWLQKMTFAQLKTYVANHATAMVEHWGERITRWEVANEMHDWANIHNLTPEQITELIRITASTIRTLQPRAQLIINLTAVYGEYAALETTMGESARRRTPLQFIRDLVKAEVDFDVIGLQLYHPERGLFDLIRLIEQFESFGKEIMLSEAGTPSYYENEEPLLRGETKWSETAQAQWAEDVFRVLGARPSIKVLCWYDLTDFRSFVYNGGVLTDDGLPKEVFTHLMQLKAEWQQAALPPKSSYSNNAHPMP